MPPTLTFLHSEDSERLAQDIRQSLGSSTLIKVVCLDVLNFPLRPSWMQTFSKSERILVLISPGFLEFVENRSDDAVSISRLIKPKSTIGAFCYEAKETDVCCFHKRALVSYDRWNKISLPNRVLDADGMLRPLMDTLPDLRDLLGLLELDDNATVKIMPQVLMVPQKASRDQNCIFLILTSPVTDTKKMSVLLEMNSVSEVPLQEINPYVVCFYVPDDYFKTAGVINVHFRHESQLLAMKELEVEAQDSRFRELVSTATSPLLRLWPSENVTSIAELQHDVNVAFSEMQDDIDNFYISMKAEIDEPEEERAPSILDLCAKYVVNESTLQLVLSSTDRDVEELPTQLQDSDDERADNVKIAPGEEMKCSTTEKISIRHEELSEPTDSFSAIPLRSGNRGLRRSMSLPSLLFPTIGSNPCLSLLLALESGYMDMSGFQSSADTSNAKPHEKFLQEMKVTQFTEEDNDIQSILSSHIYASMMLGEEGDKELHRSPDDCQSQQELMELLYAFKRGVKTISEVEQLFQEWHFKHRDSLKEQEVKLKSMKPRFKSQAFGLPDLKSLLSLKPKRKESKDREKYRNTGVPEQEKMDRHLKSLSKMSDTSTSSGSSAVSDHLGNTSSKDKNRDSGTHSDNNDPGQKKEYDDSSTVWFLSMSPTSKLAYCALPPPLPPSPPSRLPNHLDSPPNLPNRPPPRTTGTSSPKMNHKIPKGASKNKPIVMPRKKLPKTPRSPSPDYILPNCHDFVTTFPNKGPQQKGHCEESPIRTKPLKKNSAPEARQGLYSKPNDLCLTSTLFSQEVSSTSESKGCPTQPNTSIPTKRCTTLPELTGALAPIYLQLLPDDIDLKDPKLSQKSPQRML